MASNKKILAQVALLKAIHQSGLEEAAKLEQMLAGVSTPASAQQGRIEELTAKCLAKRNLNIQNKKALAAPTANA